MGDVVHLPVVTTVDLPPDKVLSAALGRLTEVIIIGVDDAGAFYFAASTSDLERVLWQIKKAERETVTMGEASDAEPRGTA